LLELFRAVARTEDHFELETVELKGGQYGACRRFLEPLGFVGHAFRQPPPQPGTNCRAWSSMRGWAAGETERDTLERLCRYISRPAVAEKRLSRTPALQRSRSNGRRQLGFF